MTKVLIYNQFDFQTLKWFEQNSDFEVLHAAAFQESEPPKDIDALIIRTGTNINEKFLKDRPNLKFIITATSGFDHIDLNACKARDIKVSYTPLANARSAAELTWTLVLACTKNLPKALRQTKEGEWKRQELLGMELSGLNYGIVGLGRVGQRVARMAQAFEMKVHAHDPYQEDTVFEELGVPRLGFEELFKTADIVSIHVPRSKETDGMISLSCLEYIKRGAVLVNTSRGSVVNEQDLALAVEKGWLRAVGLDVYRKEPLPRHSPLLRHKEIICTPHIGARTDQAMERASREAADKLIEFFKSGNVTDSLPLDAPWADDTSC